MKKLLVSALVSFSCLSLFADVRLPKIFGDNMVLQRSSKIPVWGWASPKEKVTVSFNKQVKTITADKAGKWRIDLDVEEAGGPYQLLVKGKNSITISNVLIGDVWVCSGQSNMEFQVNGAHNAAEAIKAANFPQIRHFEVAKSVASQPQADIKAGEWKVCSPATVANFTAVGYFFAKELYGQLNVPIGLIHTSWGGTHSETWTSRNAFESSDEFKSMISTMPRLNLDSLAKQKNENTISAIEKLQGPMTNVAAKVQQWKDGSFDDQKWPVLKAPGAWEQQALGDIDGVVWYRKTIEISAADAGKEAVLQLATIDDADDTYLNGIKIGSTNGYNIKRRYNIPAGVLKQGKNVIAIRILDTGGGGGIIGEPENVQLSIGSSSYTLSGEWRMQVESLITGASGVGPNSYPTLLYNAMLSPLIPFAIKGAIWYQGESNAGRAYQYRKAFPLMITDWRQHWKQGDFPFYFVQLATFNANNGNSQKGSEWAELREAQTLTLALPNTGMAVTTDIGNPTDIHPTNKEDVGKRLAAVALNKTYGKGNVFSGPTYQLMKVDGNKATISFENIGSGLSAKNKYGYLGGFEIAGADQHFHYAKAFIEDDKVVVYQEGVDKPVAIRFGWADDDSDNNLFNKEGFPAVPFRTDDWKGITENNKFSIEN